MSFSAEEGSPSGILGQFLDQGCPARSPRPATEAEQEEIQRQLEFTDQLRDSWAGDIYISKPNSRWPGQFDPASSATTAI